MHDINEDEDILVRKVIFDKVERHNVKGMKSHAGHNACEICEAEGNGPNGKVDFDYPRSTRARYRTTHRWRQTARYSNICDISGIITSKKKCTGGSRRTAYPGKESRCALLFLTWNTHLT